MPAKEIKELRQAGKLEEAYAMAKSELEADLSNIWGKRNLSWVLYAQLDELIPNLEAFITKINEVKELELPASEELFFENLSIVIAKAARAITQETPLNIDKIHILFDGVKETPLKRDSKWFSVLFNAMHKGMKESNRYIEFAEWWDFKNFRPEDFQKQKLPNGKDAMALAEQAYITYAKHLLPKQISNVDTVFDKEKAKNFLPVLAQIVEDYPQFQYPAYFNAKLLLALGDKENMLNSLLPFARKKSNDFWVWELMAEALSIDSEEAFACYCKALSCKSPAEMLVGLRQKMARLLIYRKLFNEARTEIDLLVQTRLDHGYKIPSEVTNWQLMDWYKTSVNAKSNFSFYKKYISIAEAILYSDFPEESVIVDFVNTNKKTLSFIASDTKHGFFKYEKFFETVAIGETIGVRFSRSSSSKMFVALTAVKVNDEKLRDSYITNFEGSVKMHPMKSFGFLNDIYLPAQLIKKYNIKNGDILKGSAIKFYNQDKKQWQKRVFSISE